MSAVRETVEWGFSLIVRDWCFIDFRKNLKLKKQPIGRLYLVWRPQPQPAPAPAPRTRPRAPPVLSLSRTQAAALLTNIKTCMTAEHTFDFYGNEIAQQFGISPPTLHDYLHR